MTGDGELNRGVLRGRLALVKREKIVGTQAHQQASLYQLSNSQAAAVVEHQAPSLKKRGALGWRLLSTNLRLQTSMDIVMHAMTHFPEQGRNQRLASEL